MIKKNTRVMKTAIKKTHRWLLQILLLASLGCLQPVQAQIRYEVVDGDTISVYRFLSHAEIEIEISAAVEEEDGELAYRYALESLPESKLEVYSFNVFYGETVSDYRSPTNWAALDGGIMEGGTTRMGISWWARDSLSQVRPGKTQSGFYLRSAGLPAITDYASRGWVPIPRFDVLPDSLENDNPSKDSKRGLTISPKPPPSSAEYGAFLDTLRTYPRRSRDLGWITSAALADNLEARLDKAATQLAAADSGAARSALEGLLADVERERNGALTSEAYALLKYNTEYLVERLPEAEEPPPNPEPPPVNAKADVRPILECVIDNHDGTLTAFFGYENHHGEPVTIPHGPKNKITPAIYEQLQPEAFFMPGVVPGRPGRTASYPEHAFSITFDQDRRVRWKLGRGRVTASSRTERCPE